MGRFFDKNEVIIIVVVILLLDLNASCWDFLNHIIFKSKKNTLAFMAVIGLVIVDLYVLREAVSSIRQPDITFAPNNNTHPKNCLDEANNQIKEEFETIKGLEKVCCPDPSEHGHILSEKLVHGFVIVVLLIVVVVSLTITESNYKFGEINDFETRAWRCSPLVLIALGLVYFTFSRKKV
jgi:hypothetical protein